MKAPNEKILKYNKGMKFDCIVSNAPYDNGLHEKFEYKYFELCKSEIVWVSPLSFLLGKKQNKRITLELDKYKTDIEQINGNEYFDAAIGGTMGIVFCDMADEHNEHYVKFDGKQYSKCDEIRSYSNDELLVSFYNTVEYLFTNDNLFLHLNCIPSYPFSSLHVKLIQIQIGGVLNKSQLGVIKTIITMLKQIFIHCCQIQKKIKKTILVNIKILYNYQIKEKIVLHFIIILIKNMNLKTLVITLLLILVERA